MVPPALNAPFGRVGDPIPSAGPCQAVANLKTGAGNRTMRSLVLPVRAFAVVCLLASAASPALGAAEPLAWADVNGGPVPVWVDARLVDEYQVFVDGAARAAEQAGVPVSSANGDPVVEAAGASVPVDPPARPGALAADASAPATVLADGWTLPASVPLKDIRAAAGVASDGHAAIDLTGGDKTVLAPVKSGSASTSSAPSDGAAASTLAPLASTPVARAVAALTPGATVTPKPVSSSTSPSYTPSAVALAPAPEGGAVAAATAGALAIGALLALWPLYHRLRGAETLESATRKRIYDVVCARAGAGVAEVALKGGVSYSTATYHLDRLVEAGMVVASNEGAKLRYYKNGGFNEADRKLVPLLENAEVMRLLTLIRENPGTYRAALADALNVTTTTINWHLKRLTQAGLVREERKGRSAHLYAVEEKLAGLPALGSRLHVTTDEGVATN